MHLYTFICLHTIFLRFSYAIRFSYAFIRFSYPFHMLLICFHMHSNASIRFSIPKLSKTQKYLNPSTSITAHNGPLFFQYHTSWTVGSEGTTLTSGSLRVQRHPSQVSVRRGKFYSVWRHCQWVKFAPTYRTLGGVSLDSYWPTR